MEGYIQERKGILGGLKVPFCDLPGLLMAIMALIIFKFGVFAFEKAFEEPFLLERATVKTLDFIGKGQVGVSLIDRFGQPVFSNKPWHRSTSDRIHLEKYAERRAKEDPALQKEIDTYAATLFSEWEKTNKTTLAKLKKDKKEQALADALNEKTAVATKTKVKQLVDKHFYYFDKTKDKEKPATFENGQKVKNDIVSIYQYKTGKKEVLEVRKFALGILDLFILLLWAFFSTGISRCIAIRLARDDIISVKEALLFALKNFKATLTGVLCLVIVIFVFVFCNYFAGLVASHLPLGVGAVITSILFPLVLLSSLIITLITIGVIFGVQLIPSTIATEVSDAFDSISRSIHYTFARPWEMLLLTSLVWIFLGFFFMFASFFTQATFASVGYGWGSGFDPFIRKIQGDPTFAVGFMDLISQNILFGWFFLVKLAIIGYAIYYIPAAYTTIYFLLRKDVEGDNYSQIYIEEEEEEFIKSSTAEGVVPAEEKKEEPKKEEPKKEEPKKEEVTEEKKEEASEEKKEEVSEEKKEEASEEKKEEVSEEKKEEASEEKKEEVSEEKKKEASEEKKEEVSEEKKKDEEKQD